MNELLATIFTGMVIDENEKNYFVVCFLWFILFKWVCYFS